MKTINARLLETLENGQFDQYYQLNTAFHNITRLIDSIQKGNFRAAASILQFEHWSFTLHESQIRQFYQL